jgi:hypothetical protein
VYQRSFNLILKKENYNYIIDNMDAEIKIIESDINDMEEDAKKINCEAVLDLIKHTLKCIYHLFTCCLKKKE